MIGREQYSSGNFSGGRVLLYRIRIVYDGDVRTKRSRSHLDEDDFNQAVAAEVRALLARHRKVQADVTRQLGMKPNAASFRWQGKTPWSTAELLLLCDWLDADAAEVLSAAKAAAVAKSDERQVLESMLTEQERADVDAARERMRPKDEQSGSGRRGRRREAQ